MRVAEGNLSIPYFRNRNRSAKDDTGRQSVGRAGGSPLERVVPCSSVSQRPAARLNPVKSWAIGAWQRAGGGEKIPAGDDGGNFRRGAGADLATDRHGLGDLPGSAPERSALAALASSPRRPLKNR